MTITKKQKLAQERNWAKLRLANCYETVKDLQHSDATTPLEKEWLREVELNLGKIMGYWDVGSQGLGMKVKRLENVQED